VEEGYQGYCDGGQECHRGWSCGGGNEVVRGQTVLRFLNCDLDLSLM